ncbi:MAG: hypothetical protein U1D30_22845 [Planctomycetota bacterium]
MIFPRAVRRKLGEGEVDAKRSPEEPKKRVEIPPKANAWGGISESADLMDRLAGGFELGGGSAARACRDYLLLVANEEVADDIRQKSRGQ